MRWLAGLLLAAVAVDAAKVLFLPSTLHPSHPATMKHLADELAKRKHTVVWAEHGPIESKTVLRSGVERIFWKTNFEDAHLESVFLYKNHSSVTGVWNAGEDNANEQTTGWLAGTRLCDRLLANRKKQFDELVKREFDTVVVDDLYNPCGLLMAGLKKSVFVYWSLTSLRTESAWSHHSPSPPSYIPVPGTGLTDELTFWQRTFNLASYLKAIFVHQNIVQTRIDAVYQHYYPGVESHFALERNASINLVNTPPIFDFARPFMPRVNFVGGLHCRNATKLPAKFGEFVDASNDDFGFVVFSVGYAQWKNAGERIKDAFLAAFRSNPHTRFVWQYSGRPLMNMPDNVLMADWLPLQDLLGHPKCRAHITTGGINSVIESVWHGVPVIGYPLTARGRDNLLRVTARGAGVMLEKEKLSVMKITSALDKIRDKKYKEEMLVFQDMVRDVPYTELDHAAFWVEFIERHQEVPHARSGADKLHVLQYLLVDVISFLLSCAAIALTLAYLVVRTAFRIVVAVFRSLFGRTSVKVVEKKEQKEQKKEKKEEQKEKEQPKKSKKAKKTD